MGKRQRQEKKQQRQARGQVLGSLDLTPREFAIALAAIATATPSILLVSPNVGSEVVTGREFDMVWKKFLNVALELQAIDDETMQAQLFQDNGR